MYINVPCKAGTVKEQKFKFEHRGCTLVLVANHIDGEWWSHFDLSFPAEKHRPTVWRGDGPFSTPEEAFEKAKRWALNEIEMVLE
jgi:hypothetical protein